MQAIEVFPSGDNEANLQLNADGTAARSRSLAGHTVANGAAVRMAVLECVCKAMEGR